MYKNNKMTLRGAALLFFSLLVAACGGGGGGGGSSNPPANLVVTSTQISVSASATDPAPTATINSYISSNPNATTPFYITGTFTNNGIVAITGSGDGTAANYNIQFKAPSSLGVGTYTDTVTVKGCYDSACTQQVQNSPANVAVTYSVTAAPAALTGLDPAAVIAGDAAFTLTVNGSNFTAQSVVEWNGAARSTTFVSSSEITAAITAADVASAGVASVTVASSTASDAAVSNAIDLSIQSPTPAPVVTSLSPNSAFVGSGGFTLMVNGSNFTQTSVVQWNGSARATTFVSSTQLSASIDASDVSAVVNVAVTVTADATPGSMSSSPASFTIQPLPPLMLTSISPSVITAGGPAFVLTAFGQGFLPTAVIQWNGAARPTILVSQAKLQAQISASDIAAVGVVSITIKNSASAAATAALTLTIKAVTPDAVAYQITPSHSGAVTFKSLAFPASSAWSVDVGGPPSYALIVDGKVIVTATVGTGSQLVALDQTTGAVVWGPIVLSGAANAAYDRGKILVLSGQFGSAAIMQSYDAGSGMLDWSTLLAGQYAFSSGPTALNGFAYTGGAGSGGTLYAVDEGSGAIAWTQGVANGDDSTPAVTDSGVYVTYPCWTYAFAPATGNSLFNNDTGCDGGGGATPVVANNVLYAPNGVGSYNGSTFNALTGALLNTYVADGPPAIGTQIGYFLQSGTLRGINLSSNSVLWSFTGDGSLTTSPILVNQNVIIGSSTGMIYALDGNTGSQVWNLNAGAAIPAGAHWGSGIQLTGLAAGDGLLVVPAGTKVVAYVLSTNP
jgi:outer membrane protein assembly factor BamB